MKNLLLLALLVSSSLAYAATQDINVPVGPDRIFKQQTNSGEIKMMAYNVLNLFDAEKDGNHDDWAFLPANYPDKQKHCETMSPGSDKEMCKDLDWTDYKVNLKVNQIAEVIEFQGSLPDVLVLSEIENEKVIEKLAQKLGYDDYSVTDSGTVRGTDVAILFTTQKLSRLNDAVINVTMPKKSKTRDVLRVDFAIRGTKEIMSVYANHWPAQYHPTEYRMHAAGVLKKDIDQQTKKYGKTKYYAVALGDFNVTNKDNPNPIFDTLYSKSWKNHMVDGHNLAYRSKSNPALNYMPEGTFFYVRNKAWNMLDRVVLSQNFDDNHGVEFLPETYRILFPKFMSFNLRMKDHTEVRVPYRYNFFATDQKELGYSDHLPVVFKIKI